MSRARTAHAHAIVAVPGNRMLVRSFRPDAHRDREERHALFERWSGERSVERSVLRGSWIGAAGRVDPWVPVERAGVGQATPRAARRGSPGDHLRPAWFRQIEPARVGL